jgi:hypothetical protein
MSRYRAMTSRPNGVSSAPPPRVPPRAVRPSIVRPRRPWGLALLLRALAALLLPPGLATAQTVDASILGRVRDAAGAGLANAVLVARNAATGVEWTVATTTTGRFAFLQLPLGGPYTVTARRLGFRPATRSGYELALGSRGVVDLVLDRAAAELAPVVAGTAEERRAPSLGANYRVGAELLGAIPAVNRNFTDLAALAPTTGVQASLLGQRWTATDIRIDGA